MFSKSCHHIINISEFTKIGQVSQLKGNLWLGGVGALKPQILGQNKIGAVLSILDDSMMKHYLVKQKLDHFQIKNDNHKWIPLHDQQQSNIYQHFSHSADFIQKKLNQTNVLVHCQVGVSRSASLVIGYLMLKHYIPFQDSFKLVKQKRSFISPNDSFLKQLQIFDQQIKKKNPQKYENTKNDKQIYLKWNFNHIFNIYEGKQSNDKGNLYLGGIQFFQSQGQYNPKQFTAIVSVLDKQTLLQFKVAEKLEGLNLSKQNYQHYDLQILSQEEVIKTFKQGALFIEQKLKDGNVLVHCKAGISKSSSVLIAFVMKYKKINYYEALQIVQSGRSKAKPNQKYMQLLKIYEQQIDLK